LKTKGLLAVNSTQFGALCRGVEDRFTDSKRVKWRIFGEESQFFLFDLFRSFWVPAKPRVAETSSPLPIVASAADLTHIRQV
jgi:hypothetical protein